ncbi:MAG: 3-hydroxyacyl-CoA dehydrogenase NAD-binding domain-containing protein [Hyphomicrobiales bacterium]|nr:3-hydroxyacyl-CoA dehydrogenase NAD-binding domain-containing protein [Hyphomicrobiales bacterium]
MNSIVSVTRDGDVAIILLHNPPVNALSHRLREPLDAALKAARDDPAVKAIVLACAGRTFVAGADITEFGKPQKAPSLHDLIATLETITTKPTVAAIHGTALGGGLELALGCHFRVADKGARLGLPEVKLGILPGAGGTVRLPRILGPEKAVAMIVSGTPIGALEAEEAGLVDALVDDLVPDAVAFAREADETNRALVAVRDRNTRIEAAQADMSGFEKAVTEATKKTRGLEAPLACAQAVCNAVTMPFDDALGAARRTFERLVAGDQSKAQRHLFFAEREAARVEGVGKEVKPREIRKAGIIGAGTMGGGIAMSFVNGGIPVTILEMSKEALDRGLGMIDRNYGISVSRGSLSPEAHKKRMALFTPTTNYDDLADADIIIEAVFEEMAVKKEVFSKLDAIAKPGAILASNTSYLNINEIAAITKRPGDVLGMHFFSPANVMKLLEIVRGDKTAPDVLATALATAKKIGKVPVVVGVCNGFVGNRMLGARNDESENLLLEGASPEGVDKVFTDFGWPMGPFAMWDLAGMDIGWRNRKAHGKTAVIGDALCETGRYGQKTGAGVYLYEKGSRTPTPDPEVAKLIEEKAREAGIERRTISAEEITERTLYPMINEGARILEEKIAARPSDIDIVWINGYGFPIGKGGPMFWADLTGLRKIAERLEYWHGKTGKQVFAPAPLLKKLAAEGKGFSSLGASRT